MNQYYSPLVVALLLWLVGVSCETIAPPVTPLEERSHIRFFNAYQEDPINIRLKTFEETRFLKNRLLPYGSWPEGGYMSLLPRVTITDSVFQSEDSLRFDVYAYGIDTLLIEDYEETLSRGTFASFYVVDSMGKTLMIKTSDQFGELRGDQAAYRFINLYPFFNQVNLESSNPSDDLDFTFSLEFLGYSGFKTVEAGRRSLYAVNGRVNSVIDSLPRVDLKPGGVYVFYLMSRNGFPAFEYEQVN